MKSIYHKTSKSLRLFILLMFTGILLSNAIAQQYSTIHWMHGIPQSRYTNPAIQIDSDFYFGIPALSGIHTGFDHTGFRIDDLLMHDSNRIKPFYWDQDNMLSTLNKNNYIGLNYQHEILAFGWRRDDEFFSFNLTERLDTRLGYTDDFMTLIFKGNDYFRESGHPIEFSGVGLNISHYREFGFGYSKQIMNELNAGGRAKLLFGLGNLDFKSSNVSMFTSPEYYAININSDILFNTNIPFVELEFDEEDKMLYFEEKRDYYIENYLLNFRNAGLAIDAGIVYEVDDVFEFGVSVLDLGFINWWSDANNFKIQGDMGFKGLDVIDLVDTPFFGNDDEDNNNGNNGLNNDNGLALMDTIDDAFSFEQTDNSYRTMLPTKVLLSGTYKFGDIHKAGLMLQGQFYDGIIYPSFTLGYNIQPIKQIGASLSYSIIHQNYTNVGFGLHTNIWPIQLYLVTNNFFPSLRPQTLQHTTVQLGINYVIDYEVIPIPPLHSW